MEQCQTQLKFWNPMRNQLVTVALSNEFPGLTFTLYKITTAL